MARPLAPLPNARTPADQPWIEFKVRMRHLKRAADDPSLQLIASRAGVSEDTISRVVSGLERPTGLAVRAFLTGIKASEVLAREVMVSYATATATSESLTASGVSPVVEDASSDVTGRGGVAGTRVRHGIQALLPRAVSGRGMTVALVAAGIVLVAIAVLAAMAVREGPESRVDDRAGSPAGDGTFIARTAQGRGFLVDPGAGTVRHITNGGDFLCYASGRLVRDQVQAEEDDAGRLVLELPPPNRVVGDAPTCRATSVTWTYSPPPEGNVPRPVILRGRPADDVVSAWYVDGEGQVAPIRGGATYSCLAMLTPVIWNVPLEKIDEWRPEDRPAECPEDSEPAALRP